MNGLTLHALAVIAAVAACVVIVCGALEWPQAGIGAGSVVFLRLAH